MTEICKIEYYLPDNILSNEALEKEFPEWSAAKIGEKIGIETRHISGENETALDMAVKASEKLFSDFDRNKIDFVLLCTQSPDYFLPTSACILQDRLKLRTNIGALDFNLGCSGFIYGLALAKGLVNTGIASCILLVTSETYSKHIHSSDKANRSIFGDGAAATIISKAKENKILEFDLGTDGSGMNNLIIENGGLRNKFNSNEDSIFEHNNFISNKNFLYMNGPEIFNFTIQKVPALIQNTLEINKMKFEEIDFFIMHQANKYMLDYLRKKLKIPGEKFYNNMLHAGNTVSSTIPIALKDSIDKGLVKNNDKVLLAGFGVGYSWGATIITI